MECTINLHKRDKWDQEGEPPSLKSCSSNKNRGEAAQFFLLASDRPKQRQRRHSATGIPKLEQGNPGGRHGTQSLSTRVATDVQEEEDTGSSGRYTC